MQRIWIGLLAAILSVGAYAATHGNMPTSTSIPVSSLAATTYPSNNWSGLVTPATIIATAGDGLKYIQSQSNASAQMLATSSANWRDVEVTSYFSTGLMLLRMSNGKGLYFSITGNTVSIGIVTGFSATDPQNSGTRFSTLFETNASGCITNWPSTGSHTFTFGASGFNVYLKIDGVIATDTCKANSANPTGAISYYEYREQAMASGNIGLWASASSNGARDVTVTYLQQQKLFSFYDSGVFDPRDFGMRTFTPVTGSMSASSTTLNLTSAADLRVGDQVIVEVGGETPAGYNTVGVGGVSPVLNYANATARDADHSQADGTYAYLQTDGSVWVYSAGSTTWSAANIGGTYYVGVKTALSLVAKVLAVNASPATQVTLSVASTVATTNANVYLDSLPSYYPYTTDPRSYFDPGVDDALGSYSNMTLNMPAGTYYFSERANAQNANGAGGNRTSFTLNGNGSTIVSPKGVPSRFIDTGNANNNVTVTNINYVGNLADVGYGFGVTGTNKQIEGDYPVAMSGGVNSTNLTYSGINCTNDFRGCVSILGINPQILNSTTTVNVQQRAYLQWQFQLVDCTGGQINNATATGTYLLKSFEMFACNGSTITNITATNALFSTNSSTNWTISNFADTITTSSYINSNSGGLDEAIINVNDNAFGSGSIGTVNGNWSIVQSGYVDGAGNSSLKFFQIDTHQTNVTITGGFPGGGGCSTSLPGFMSAPNYVASNAEYGAMAVYSDAANTTVTGIRIKGTAVGSPGHSGHFGNISLLGASSSATNNVADVIQTGPTQSGNQTNAAYGGC